ncbi:MAG: YqeG family HAD IIIA-type phosphatase [Pseudobutyrivibrio sp.]|nr:YqeG family HAD IIIA-type phosphatase [Pseudobutyrivibrio sp.]
MKISNLYPKEYVKSTYGIDFEGLFEKGFRGVIFDVDNTLVPHGAPADERAVEFFERLNAIGFKAVLLSNNKEPRVKSFCEDVKFASYIYRAGKPNPKGYLKACENMGIKPEEAIFVGDQIFTDVWGANRAGIFSFMVEPVLKWKEEPQIVLKRFAEAVVLGLYKIHIKKTRR